MSPYLHHREREHYGSRVGGQGQDDALLGGDGCKPT